MSPNKQAAAIVEAFINDAEPFLDLLKIEGYFTETMELTEKGKSVLLKHFQKKYQVKFYDGTEIVKVN